MTTNLSDDQIAVIHDAALGCDGIGNCDVCGRQIPEDAPCEVCDPDGWDAYCDAEDAAQRAFLGEEAFFVSASAR